MLHNNYVHNTCVGMMGFNIWFIFNDWLVSLKITPDIELSDLRSQITNRFLCSESNTKSLQLFTNHIQPICSKKELLGF